MAKASRMQILANTDLHNVRLHKDSIPDRLRLLPEISRNTGIKDNLHRNQT